MERITWLLLPPGRGCQSNPVLQELPCAGEGEGLRWGRGPQEGVGGPWGPAEGRGLLPVRGLLTPPQLLGGGGTNGEGDGGGREGRRRKVSPTRKLGRTRPAASATLRYRQRRDRPTASARGTLGRRGAPECR